MKSFDFETLCDSSGSYGKLCATSRKERLLDSLSTYEKNLVGLDLKDFE